MKLAILAAAVATAAIAVPASAAQIITTDLGTISKADAAKGLYLSPSVTVAAPTGGDNVVNSYYTFTLGAKTTVSGVMNAGTFTSSAPTPVMFTGITLYDGNYTGTGMAPTTTALTVGQFTLNGSNSISYAPVTLDAGRYSILVSGTNTDNTSIGSSISFTTPAAVPEAATWAMMLVGFGGIGGALRSNRRKVTFA